MKESSAAQVPVSVSSLKFALRTRYTQCVHICDVRCCHDHCTAPNFTISMDSPSSKHNASDVTSTRPHARHREVLHDYRQNSPHRATLGNPGKKPSTNLLTENNGKCHQKAFVQSIKTLKQTSTSTHRHICNK